MKRLTIFLTAACLIVMFATTSVWAAKLTKDIEKSTVFNSGTVVIKSTEGNIQVSCSDEDQVVVLANIEVKAKDKAFLEAFTQQVDIALEHEGDQLVIKPDYPVLEKGDQFQQWTVGGKKPEIKVQYTVMVPRKLNVTAKSEEGDIEIDRVCGAVRAQSKNGSVVAKIQTIQADCKQEYQSMNGAVRVYMSRNTEADVDMNTLNGHIHSEFPPVSNGYYNATAMKVQVNGGGKNVSLKTYNGSIYLFKSMSTIG